LDREIKKIDHGIVVTITSNDPQVVKRLHRRADLFEKREKKSKEDILSPYLKGYMRGYCDSEIDHLGTGKMERGMHMMMGGW
jgi:hypothetical protein